MEVLPIASESLGVRSMATYVKTKDCKIFIDPSAALGPSRYGLTPAKQELEALNKYKSEIHTLVINSDILIISHYHYDHYDPHETFYEGKKIFAKDRKNNINASQKKRGREFEKNVKDFCEIIYCDDKSFEFGNTEIKFSVPFPHGPEGIRLGFVLMTTIKEDIKLLHASDVQGPVAKSAKDYIISENPNILIIDGPPSYFLGWKFSKNNLEQAQENLAEIIEQTNCEVILDHHLLRDLKYKERFSRVYEKGNIKTFAEYLGKDINMLEAHRKEQWRVNNEKSKKIN